MDVANAKKVFIIFDRDRFTQSMVLDELAKEGFPYFFKTMDTIDDVEILNYYIEHSDEVWTFGDVKNEQSYSLAVNYGKDIWEMA